MDLLLLGFAKEADSSSYEVGRLNTVNGLEGTGGLNVAQPCRS